jgi:parallel beta-helix repeat protein
MNLRLLALVIIFLYPICSYAANVRDFGARGDGKTDDTDAIRSAVRSAEDGMLMFPRGRYRITSPILIDLAKLGPLGISGSGGSATIVQEGAGPAFLLKGTHKGSALPASVTSQTWEKERMVNVENIEIVGSHPEADGIWLEHLMQPTIRGCLIRNVRHGIRLSQRNRNVLLEGNHIYDCSGVGIYLDSVNLHQIIISHSHISYCKEAGIKVRSGEIRNFQITGNDIEYNFSEGGVGAADVYIDLSHGGSVREGTITGNTIQALESKQGANIRFSGDPAQPHKLGLWSITGNHISNQHTCIWLQSVRGISISGNTFVRAYSRHLDVENSSQIVFSSNVIDYNPDYFTENSNVKGGISVRNSSGVLVHDNVLDGYLEEIPFVAINRSKQISLKDNSLSNVGNPGIEVYASEATIIQSNRVFSKNGKSVALKMSGNCSESVVSDNQFKNMKIVIEGKGISVKRNRTKP